MIQLSPLTLVEEQILFGLIKNENALLDIVTYVLPVMDLTKWTVSVVVYTVHRTYILQV